MKFKIEFEHSPFDANQTRFVDVSLNGRVMATFDVTRESEVQGMYLYSSLETPESGCTIEIKTR